YAAINTLDKGNGGTFYVAGPLSINTSEIVNSRAAAEGGAIYSVAMNTERNIVIQDSLIQKNQANYCEEYCKYHRTYCAYDE
ncbi:hypothetical protein, partial [Klebsiella pneumoniae]|uniref:hypothetical protein n=1 Tax=Klebsiella pneumoniae TaxID=573 RepID=UPI001C4E0571